MLGSEWELGWPVNDNLELLSNSGKRYYYILTVLSQHKCECCDCKLLLQHWRKWEEEWMSRRDGELR